MCESSQDFGLGRDLPWVSGCLSIGCFMIISLIMTEKSDDKQNSKFQIFYHWRFMHNKSEMEFELRTKKA